jgi:RNA polymerase sigma factor (sigma-70 family)
MDAVLQSPGLEAARMTLGDVQQFLKCQARNVEPDAASTRAWHCFYRRYTNVIRRRATAFHFDAEEGEDLAQEVWAEVITHLPEFDWHGNPCCLRAWFDKVVRTRALNLIRRRRRQPNVSLNQAPAHTQLADRNPGPADHSEAQSEREHVHVLLEELQKRVSPLNYRLLHMRWLEDRNVPEVASALNLTAKQVVYRQRRMFQKLRAALAARRREVFESPRPL